MGKSKDFSSAAFGTLTGTAKKNEETVVNLPPPAKKANKEVATKVAAEKNSTTSEGKGNSGSSSHVSQKDTKTPGHRTRKKMKLTVGDGVNGLQDPNMRSVKVKNKPFTFYLNAVNAAKLKDYADEHDQKPSWILDEIIYEFLSEALKK